MQACDSSAGSGGARKQGLALSLARGWRKLVGEATDEVRWLPTGCLQLLDTLQQVGGQNQGFAKRQLAECDGSPSSARCSLGRNRR